MFVWGLGLVQLLEKHAKLVLLGFALVIVSMAAGIAKLQTTVNVQRMFPKEHALWKDYAWFESNVAPIVNAELEVEFTSSPGIDFDERFELVRSVHASLVAANPEGGVLSAVTFVPTLPQGSSIGSVSRRAAMRTHIRSQFASFEQSGLASRTGNSEYWRFTLRYPFFSDVHSSAFLKSMRTAAESPLRGTPKVQVRMSGTTALANVAQELLFDGLIKSFLSTFVLIWLAMLMMLRSFPLSALAMLPNLFPFVTLFGALGLSGEPLDIGIVMAASVALGIAVDDTIHFLTQYRASLSAGYGRSESVHQALRHSGTAMFQSTAICVATMIVYVWSDFVPMQRFSWLMCCLLVAALMGDLMMMPALLWTRISSAFKVPMTSV